MDADRGDGRLETAGGEQDEAQLPKHDPGGGGRRPNPPSKSSGARGRALPRGHKEIVARADRPSPAPPYPGVREPIAATERSLGPVAAHHQPARDDGRCAEPMRSEEHTSELQSPCNLVCRLLLEKKKLDVDQH